MLDVAAYEPPAVIFTVFISLSFSDLKFWLPQFSEILSSCEGRIQVSHPCAAGNWNRIYGFLEFLLTYLLTFFLSLNLTHSTEQSPSWELSCSQLVNKFPAFYGTRMFITSFTVARHLSLSWANSIQSIPPHPTSWRSALIVSSYLRLGLPSGLFRLGFPTKTP
jgi:hypothetical protein